MNDGSTLLFVKLRQELRGHEDWAHEIDLNFASKSLKVRSGRLQIDHHSSSDRPFGPIRTSLHRCRSLFPGNGISRGRDQKTSTFTSLPNGVVTLNATQTAGLEALGTVRARLGYAIDRNLFFVTGGLAYGEVKASTMATAVTNPALMLPPGTDIVGGSASGWRAGYTVGGGYEYAFTNNLTGKIEYLFYNLGTANYSVAPANSFTVAEERFINASQKFDGNVLRVGLNWKY